MRVIRWIPFLALLATLSVSSLSCGDTQEASESALVYGHEAMVLLPNDTIVGIAVQIRTRDGALAPALFRGPTRLADVLSGGTWLFDEDSLPSRVRRLEPGEELQPRG